MVAGLFTPLGAQKEVSDVEFATVTCRQMDVVDEEGNKRVMVGTLGTTGLVSVFGKGYRVVAEMNSHEHGGAVIVRSVDGGQAEMSGAERGGWIAVRGKEESVQGQASVPQAVMALKEGSGSVLVRNTHGEMATMGWGKYGGEVAVRNRDGSFVVMSGVGVLVHAKDGRGAGMSLEEHGGSVVVRGKGTNDRNRGLMHVDEYGNGIVSTSDKNGYRLATLK